MKKLITVILLVVALSILFALPASAVEMPDPLAVKFDDTVGYCDTFYESIPWYVVCQLSWDLVEWDYDVEFSDVQIPADEYEAAAAKYCVLSEELLAAIRSETDYGGNPIYDPETNTYTVFYVGGWGGFLHNRVYAGYVQTGEDTYDVYYETVSFEFLEDILPEGTTLEDIVGEDWPTTVEYEDYVYTNSPDGYYRIKSYDKSGIKYGVKLDGDNVLLATRTPYSVGQQPDDFDDVSIEELLTYEIVDGKAIITDCDDSVSGEILIPDTLDGYPVTTIAQAAFAHLTNPFSINTGNSVKVIEDAAFLGSTGLEGIILGNNVQSVSALAFEACENLRSINVYADNANFSSIDAMLFNKNATVLVCVPKTIADDFTVPAGVLTVADYAFDGCDGLTSLVVGDGVTTIGKRAFNNCMNLKTVQLGSSVKTVGEYAFNNCSRINKLFVSLSVTDIKDHAFQRCSGLTDVFYAGTESQWNAINIGSNNDPFYSATFHFESTGDFSEDPWYLTYEIVDGEAVITGCDSSVEGSLELPATLGGYPVTTIAMNAFRFSQITDITLPETLTTIKGNAFYGSAIRGIYIPAGVHTIDAVAFQACANFTGFTVSEDNPFYASDNYGVLFNKPMTELIMAPGALTGTYSIPEGVTTVDYAAFFYCSQLTQLNIPASTTNIDFNADIFKECNNLSTITVDPENPSYCTDEKSVIYNAEKTAIYYAPKTLSGVYIVPEGVTAVHDAFENCAELTGLFYPESLTSIDSELSGCKNLEKIYIPESAFIFNFHLYPLVDAQTQVFYGGSLEQWDAIYMLDNNKHPDNLNIMYNCAPVIWNFTWYVSGTEVYITDCDETATGVITVPATLNGYTVAGIDPWAFQECDGITEIHLPDSVTYIGINAFAYCDKLTAVTMSDNVSFIGDGAFTGCTSLTEVDIPDNVTAIEANTFAGCRNLQQISIPGSVCSIGDYAFASCTSLTEITVPDGVTVIGQFAFKECNWLRSIVIPDSVTFYGNNIFEYCSNLQSVVLGEGIQQIPGGMFWACTSLREVTLSDTVTRIDDDAFHFCDNLTDVYYRGTEAQKQNITIEDTVIPAATWHYNSCIGSAEHTHDNGCDTICNVCDAERTAAHSFDNACDPTCNTCPYTRTTSHSYGTGVVTRKATCKEAGVMTYTCGGCSGTKTEPIAKLTTHTYTDIVTKATLSKDGKIESKCSVCGKVASTTAIAKPTTFTLSTVNYTYNGAVKTPGVTVKDANGKTLVKGTDYTVTYPSGRKALGTYTVTITMKGNYSGTKTLTFNIKLGTPTVTASNAATGVKITWNAISGAKNYKVYKSVYSGGKWSSWTAIKTGVTGTTYTDTSVKSADNVKYTVRAFNGSHSSTYKASNSIKYLAAPTVKASNAVNGVKITWNKVSGAKTYTVYKSTYTNGAWSGWKAIKTGLTTTTYTDTSVKSADNVRYTVRVFNGNFSSNFKASNSIKFLATPTVTIANAATGVKISWNKITGAKTYTVYRSTYSNGAWSGWTAIKTGVTGTTFTDTAVKSGATVRYTVKVINGSFTSYIKASATTKYLAQPTVKVAKATNGIKASWGKVTGATGYIVYRRTYSNGKWGSWTQIKTTTAVSYTDTTAKAGVTYQYTVRAYSGSYKSSYTNSTSIKR